VEQLSATRSELIARRLQIGLATQGRDLLKEKRAALVVEFGHLSSGVQRLSLVEGTAFLPSSPVRCRLLTLRQAGSHLFLRYELPSPGQVGA
jgi:hypothetical protein